MRSMLDGLARVRVTALVAALLLLSLPMAALAAGGQMPRLGVLTDDSGSRLQVDGRDFMVLGMNWDYVPIGTNYGYSLWTQPDDFIKQVLDREMPLLQAMHVNAIRLYVGIQPKWIQYIYERYGIFTVLNHTVGRYGLTIDGAWLPNTDYSDPKVRNLLKGELAALVDQYKGTPGILMWLLGNENNYGLTWASFEIEALPKGEQHAARARYLYSLFGEIIDDIKQRDPNHLVCIANGDLQYIDLVAEYCGKLDVMGSNVYRGISARDFFQVVKDKLNKPVIFTEFGSDAFNARTMREDQAMQARFLVGQWQEIYEQAAGKGRVGNAAGGLVFQWSDGWWKFMQETRLNIHDTNASWPNGGYPDDFSEGDNNMNEEWWGITAKGFPDAAGFYELYPRAAYYALRDAWSLDPYASGVDKAVIANHYANVRPAMAVLEARGDAAALKTDALSKVRLAGVRMEFETYATGAKNTSTPEATVPGGGYPAFRGFDHMQSFWTDFEAMPSDQVTGRLSLNILGNVPLNPIDEIFYENRGRPVTARGNDGTPLRLEANERVKVYQSSITWDDRWFTLDGFYRTGHLHWQYEGDFFGLYRDAYYGENIDIYNGEAPIGFEIAGKRQLAGLKLAFGPQLWWGANPAIFAKYGHDFAGSHWTAIYQEDFAQQSQITSSAAIPTRTTRKAALAMTRRVGPFNFEGGALWSGQPRVGESFQIVDENLVDANVNLTQDDIRTDTIKDKDTWGVKGKLTWQKGKYNWYGQGAYMGLASEAGPTAIPTFTGWELKDSGSGNQVNALTGLAVTTGVWQIGPNFLWQKPLVGPMPNAMYMEHLQGRARNVIDDPFAVRGNRETTAGELMVTYDPTPATWMWQWDNDTREDADLAASMGLSVRRHHTTADAGLFVAADGNVYAFPGATPARDLWTLRCRVVKRLGAARMISHLAWGTAEPNSDDQRLVHMFSVDSRVAWPSVVVSGAFKLNDFGPYDYQRDFNLTYPMQTWLDISTTLGSPRWFDLPQTRLGVRATYRTLDRWSPRYMPEGEPEPIVNEKYPDGLAGGNEWEIRTYLHLAI